METTNSSNQKTKEPGFGIWLGITLLWGSVFFWSSVLALQFVTGWMGEGMFQPAGSGLMRVYGVHVMVLVLFALLAMIFKRMVDPGATRQATRRQEIDAGKGERIFISLLGSIATSFFFTLLTALTFALAAGAVGVPVALTLPVVFVAGLFNIVAGLAASLLVGILFIVAKVGKK
uniref:Uncharacterized protein n=1 Tax=Chlorobium chlorochromatii (strain CaD3) TaxID=340177 RepID=Q3AT76_CHLCH